MESDKEIEKLLEEMFSSSSNGEIDSVLTSFQKLNEICTEEQIPILVTAMQSTQSNFWLRELLAEPISQIGGSTYLPALFEALKKGELEGHDNDSLCFFLIELAESESETCQTKLNEIISDPENEFQELALWLIEFCKSAAEKNA
ncbi:hypothetical protein CKQ84_17875 [Shewanella sp. WE21]|jgi:hypothetical protein|uniref:hypothetical protein n=1 Tax=Shewanella sp. WE21 TaxID=2029986 RepID=UPI000CF73D66|nr:hypothetical protein [Shewanella sp. WE21]AVI67578.1 hypothetical protein CKQ84_17875 [Shewanella sp. WE21]